jgi:hypothetical protein
MGRALTTTVGVAGWVRRALAIATAAAVLWCAAGCGGTSTPSGQTEAEKWADDVCSSISSWHDSVAKARSTLQHPANLSLSTFEATVREVGDATTKLVKEIGNLGPPDTTAGNQAAEQLSHLSAQLDQQMTVVRKAVHGGAANATEMLASLSTITGALATMAADIKTTLKSLGSLDGATELRDAFKGSATCQQLTAGASPS